MRRNLIYLGVLGFLAWVIPFSVYWPVGRPVDLAIFLLYVTPGIYLTDIAIILVVILFLRGFRPELFVSLLDLAKKVKFISLPLLVLVIVAGLSIPFARSHLLAVYTTLRWLIAVVLFFSMLGLGFSTSQFITFLIVGLGVEVCVGIGQVIHQGPLGFPGELALEITQPRAAIIRLENASFLRIYGFSFHPNVLGGYLCAGLVLSLPLLKQMWIRLIWWLMALGLVLTFSRSAWLAAALTIPLTTAWLFWRFPDLRHPIRWTFIPALLLGLGAIALFFEEITVRLNPFQSYPEYTSIIGRGQLIAISLDIILQKPLTGIGAGNFPLAVLDYKTLDPAHYVHNVPLLLASEVGLLGGLLWYWLWLAPLGKIQRYWKSDRPWLFVLIMAWFAWGIISLWDFYPWALELGGFSVQFY